MLTPRSHDVMAGSSGFGRICSHTRGIESIGDYLHPNERRSS